MATLMAADEITVHPDGALVVDGAEADEESVSAGFLVRGADVLESAFVPHYLVGFVEVNARCGGLECIGYFDLPFLAIVCLGWDALVLPLLRLAYVGIIEDEVPCSVEGDPVQGFTLEVGARVQCSSHLGMFRGDQLQLKYGK